MDTPKVLGMPSGRKCPECDKATIWTKGAYSVYHRCEAFPACQGKIGAPRGASAKAADPSTSADPVIPSATVAAPTPAATVAAEVQAQNGIGGALWLALEPIVRAEIDKRAAVVAEEFLAANGGSTKTIIHTWIDTSGITVATIEGGHAMAPALIKRIRVVSKKNFFLVGPAGCGKTTLAHDVAKALGLDFAAISCTAGMPEWHLVGRCTPNLVNPSTPQIYVPSRFVEIYQNGGVFLLDEVDASDENTLIAMNAALANGSMNVVGLGMIKRHANCIVIAAANTFGRGADRMYVGRNQLDGAFLDRFVGRFFEMDYDRDMEAKLYPHAQVLNAVWKLRDDVQRLRLRQIVGTRAMEIAYEMVASKEYTLNETLVAITSNFTPDERSKVGVPA